MCRIRIAILLCAAALLGRSMAQAQDNVSLWTKALLKAEWQATALVPSAPAGTPVGLTACLTALNYYTVPLPAHGSDEALALLIAGIDGISPVIPPIPPTVSRSTKAVLYTRAQAAGKMAELLATTTASDIDASEEKRKKGLFDKVDKSIRDTYKNDLTGLDDRVNKIHAKDPARALYNLLNDLLQYSLSLPAPASLADTANTMQDYRTCYLLDKGRLFGLVRTFLE